MKNIHVLPTEKPSRLCYDRDDNLLFAPNAGFTYGDGKQHLYITSDEKLPYDSSIFDSGAFYHRDPVGDVHIITKHTFKPNPHFCKRIILTTDQDLIADGVQEISKDFLQWFVKNPSCEFVEVKEKQHFEADKSKRIDPLNGVYYSYKIIIPQEEPKQEPVFPQVNIIDEWLTEHGDPEITKQVEREAEEIMKDKELEDAAVNSWFYYEHVEGHLYSTSYKNGFKAGVKYQAERMLKELQLRLVIIKSEPDGLVRETMINNLLIDLKD
jgi:hypothetical protein